MIIIKREKPIGYAGQCELVGQRDEDIKNKEIAKTLETKQLPRGKEVKIHRDCYLYVGDTVFKVWFNGTSYRFINLSSHQLYRVDEGEEKILGREGDILVDETDTKASRKHLKVRVDSEGNLFLCNNSKNGTFIDEVESTKEVNNKMSCKKMTTKEINEVRYGRKTRAAEYFYERYKPDNKIDLGNGKVIYTTNVFVPDYDEIIGYIMDGDCIEARMFYRSNSEGIWRACPGVREGKDEKAGKDDGLSKGEEIINYSYETTTKVVTQLGEIFDSFKREGTGGADPIFDTTKGKDKLGFNILMKRMTEETSVEKLFSNEELGNIIITEAELNDDDNDVETKAIFSDLIQRCEKFKKTGKTFHSLSDFIRFKDKNGDTQEWTTESIIRMCSNAVPSGLDYSHMIKLLDKSYDYKHEDLGTIHTDVYQANWKGKSVNMYFSRVKDEPNLVWIDNIQYSDAEINSFGIIKKSINAVPLVGKPCDYWDQTPYDYKKNPERRVGYKYADIRDFYQDNPIIKHYKKLEGLS